MYQPHNQADSRDDGLKKSNDPTIYMPKSNIVVGVVADTHGYLNPRVVEVLRGVSHILVAGDTCSGEVVEGLEEIAPVMAVRGE
jgi:hypothetical protein